MWEGFLEEWSLTSFQERMVHNLGSPKAIVVVSAKPWWAGARSGHSGGGERRIGAHVVFDFAVWTNSHMNLQPQLLLRNQKYWLPEVPSQTGRYPGCIFNLLSTAPC